MANGSNPGVKISRGVASSLFPEETSCTFASARKRYYNTFGCRSPAEVGSFGQAADYYEWWSRLTTMMNLTKEHKVEVHTGNSSTNFAGPKIKLSRIYTGSNWRTWKAKQTSHLSLAGVYQRLTEHRQQVVITFLQYLAQLPCALLRISDSLNNQHIN